MITADDKEIIREFGKNFVLMVGILVAGGLIFGGPVVWAVEFKTGWPLLFYMFYFVVYCALDLTHHEMKKTKRERADYDQ